MKRLLLLALVPLLLAGCLETPTGRVIEDSCVDDPYFQITRIDDIEQACYDDNTIKIVLENGAEYDIKEVRFMVLGDGNTFEHTKEVSLDKGFASTIMFPYDHREIATPRYVGAVPIVKGIECGKMIRTAPLRPCE